MIEDERQRSAAAVVEDGAARHLRALGLRVEVHTNFGPLVEIFRRWRPELRDPVNPAFNPARQDIDPASWWVRLSDGGGAVAAVHAMAIYREADYFSLMASGRLWYGPGRLPDDWHRMPKLRPMATAVTGTLCHGGAMVVAPAWRQHRLATLLSAYNRARLLRLLAVDFMTGTVLRELHDPDIAAKIYGYPRHRRALVLSGYWPVVQRAVQLWAGYASAEETMAYLSELRLAA